MSAWVPPSGASVIHQQRSKVDLEYRPTRMITRVAVHRLSLGRHRAQR